MKRPILREESHKSIKMKNPLNYIDFYKADHRSQYPEKTEFVFSNLTPRKSRLDGINEIVFFGLQYFIKEYLIQRWNDDFFNKPIEEVIKAYKHRMDNAIGAGVITYEHIEELHALGYLPIKIMALPEGSIVPMRVAPMVLFNTHKDFFWLTNYLESILSCIIWGPCNSASIARQYRLMLDDAAVKTGADLSFVPFQGHDFSFRGMFGLEASCLSSAGHLLSFVGTDTVPAIDFLEEFYGADASKEMIGVSVPATEHSVMCMGTKEDEIETFRRLITETYPTGIVSIVSDTWNFWKVITEYLPELRNEIYQRKGKVVIRPDSGDPVKIICGDPDAQPGTPEYKGAVKCLWQVFGGTTTHKHYRVLHETIGLIYGDSITTDRCQNITRNLREKNFASTNVVFGIGSYTYQYNTRDTFGFAVKATYGIVDGEAREIYKDPITDDGTKKSAKGLIAVYSERVGGKFVMHDQVTMHEVMNCEFKTVFENGELHNEQTLSEIRERLKQ